jgi:hypothetical protein
MTEREQRITDASDVIEQNEMLIARELLKDDPNLEYIGTLIEFNVNYARKIRELNSASEQMFEKHKDIYMKVDPPQDRGKLVMRELIKGLNDPEYITHKMASNMPNVPSNYEDIPEECYTKCVVYDKDKYPLPIEKTFHSINRVQSDPSSMYITDTFFCLCDYKIPSNVTGVKNEFVIFNTSENLSYIVAILEVMKEYNKCNFNMHFVSCDIGTKLIIYISVTAEPLYNNANVEIIFDNDDGNETTFNAFKEWMFMTYGKQLYSEQEGTTSTEDSYEVKDGDSTNA